MQQLLERPVVTETIAIQDPVYFKIYINDPRPDLSDTDLWTKLLGKVIQKNHIKTHFHLQALSCLWKVRSVGTILKWDRNFSYRLMALIDFGNWDNIEDWNDTKARHLMQYKDIYRQWFMLIDFD